MKTILSVLCTAAIAVSAQAQTVSAYLEKIRNNDAMLTAFFAQMPKGGDLHHHYSGSVYTETYIDRVVQNNYYINKKTMLVSKTADADPNWIQFSKIRPDSIAWYKQQLVQKWSVKDYNGVSYPSDLQFFETFGYFGVTSGDSLKAGLLELKGRAVKENLNYIETMFIMVPYKPNTTDIQNYKNLLWSAQQRRDEKTTQALLSYLYDWFQKNNLKGAAEDFNKKVTGLHRDAKIDDDKFTMRYQNYIVRVINPLDVFKSMAVSFESAAKSPLIVGVNIVAPENNDTSMHDYWLHMQMYKFCHGKYPQVKYSMHAGELALGMVKPEEMTWHITEAVHTAKASRIGHGVDIPYELNSYDLLDHMSANKIAVEINLFSNEFILKVQDDKHPISLYRDFGVPIVISTDDAGVLRTNLTDQYVLLAKRYKDIPYMEIKQYVYNSIRYSFIEEPAVKNRLIADLDKRFEVFEAKVKEIMKK